MWIEITINKLESFYFLAHLFYAFLFSAKTLVGGGNHCQLRKSCNWINHRLEVPGFGQVLALHESVKCVQQRPLSGNRDQIPIRQLTHRSWGLLCRRCRLPLFLGSFIARGTPTSGHWCADTFLFIYSHWGPPDTRHCCSCSCHWRCSLSSSMTQRTPALSILRTWVYTLDQGLDSVVLQHTV